MKRLGRFVLLLAIISCSAAGMWLYQSWRAEQELLENRELSNVYAVKGKGNFIAVYTSEGELEYEVKDDLTDMEYTGFCDICVRRDKVDKLVCKPDQIGGKVLAIGANYIELENYGQISLEEGVSCYTKGSKISISSIEDIYIGQTDAAFAVAEGKICGVLCPEQSLMAGETAQGESAPQTEEPASGGGAAKGEGGAGMAEQKVPKDTDIRVIIKTDGFASYEHAQVRLRGTKKLYVRSKKSETEVQPGEEVAFTPESMKEKRVTVRSEEGGRIEISSISRSGERPLYRGTIEVVRAVQGLWVINELPIEEYLYGVIPSEMPAEYENEALKAQAVCARSYAANHMKNNRLKEMGAHVDDSVSYQVYNNTREDERCNRAVDETAGVKAYYGGKLASTYFFSTACGVTSSALDVGFCGEDIPYLCGRLQEREMADESAKDRARLASEMFGNEDLFRKFLEEDRDILEKTQPWYRWSTSISVGDMENNINAKLGERSKAAGENIQVRQADGTYASQTVEGIGQLKRVRIKKRGSGGVVSMAVIVGTEHTVRVYTEYNIRLLLFSENAVITKNDGKRVSGMTMLPSGFFVCDRSGTMYEFRGGGFGHGTGMSQTGANELAQAGKNYEEILGYYFSGVELKAA